MNFKKFLLSAFGALQVTSNSVLPSMAAPVLPQGDVNGNPPPEEVITPTEEIIPTGKECAVVIVRDGSNSTWPEAQHHAENMENIIRESIGEKGLTPADVRIFQTDKDESSFRQEKQIVNDFTNLKIPIIMNLSYGTQRTIEDIKKLYNTIDEIANSYPVPLEENNKWLELRNKLNEKYGEGLQNLRFSNATDPDVIALLSFNDDWEEHRKNLIALSEEPYVSVNVAAGNELYTNNEKVSGPVFWNDLALGVPEVTVVGVKAEHLTRYLNEREAQLPLPGQGRGQLVRDTDGDVIDPNVYQNNEGGYYLRVDYNRNGTYSTPLDIDEREAELIQKFTEKNIEDLKNSQQFITQKEFKGIQANRSSIPLAKHYEWIALATNGAVVETDTPGVVFAPYQTASGKIRNVSFLVNEQGTLRLNPETYGLSETLSTSTATAMWTAQLAVKECNEVNFNRSNKVNPKAVGVYDSRADNYRLLQQQTDELNKQSLAFYNSLKDNSK
ncbi:MAG: hypothetical protein ACK5O1_04960 [Holosporales bacterium]|jgi:hypothetical protein